MARVRVERFSPPSRPARDAGLHRQRRPADPIFYLHEHLGNHRVLSMLRRGAVQGKFEVGDASDPAEQEADRMAEALGSAARRPSERCGCGTCATCTRVAEPIVQRAPAGGAMPEDAPPIVSDVLRSPGHPIDPATRAMMETHFGHDFGDVRIHSDAEAAVSARAIDAHAYTVGRDIVFAEGRYAPHSAEGRKILTHELTHVVQQANAGTSSPQRLQRYASCRDLLDAEERKRVAEGPVRDAVAQQVGKLGSVERELPLPGASAQPWRTEPAPGGDDEIIEPQTLSEVSDVFGRADIALLNGTALEVAEVKHASWHEAYFAEEQLRNYVQKGNRAIRDVRRLWRRRGHSGDVVKSVRAMPTDRVELETPQRINDDPVSLAWCRDGVISFKAVADSDKDTLVCGVSDQGRIDAALDRLLDPAQAQVEQTLTELEDRLVARIYQMSLKQISETLIHLPGVHLLLPAQATVESVATFLKPFEAEIRARVRDAVHRLIARLRQQVQSEMRAMLQASVAAVCVAGVALTKEVLADFEKRLKARLRDLMPAVAMAVAYEVMRELLAELVTMVIGVVVGLAVFAVLAILLWEEGLIASALAWLSRLVALPIPAFGY